MSQITIWQILATLSSTFSPCSHCLQLRMPQSFSTSSTLPFSAIKLLRVSGSLSVRELVQTCSDSCESPQQDRATGEKGTATELELGTYALSQSFSHTSYRSRLRSSCRPILLSCGDSQLIEQINWDCAKLVAYLRQSLSGVPCIYVGCDAHVP